MKIEIFSNFACPFCYIGKERLEQAKEVVDRKINIAGGTDVCGPDGCQL